MRTYRIEDFHRGWFVGAFKNSAFQTEAAEVCVVEHFAGEMPREHYHAVATEITLVLSGVIDIRAVLPNGTSIERTFRSGDVFVVEPFTSVAPCIIMDSRVVVVKVPSKLDDKYFTDEHPITYSSQG